MFNWIQWAGRNSAYTARIDARRDYHIICGIGVQTIDGKFSAKGFRLVRPNLERSSQLLASVERPGSSTKQDHDRDETKKK
jgi:hypothetical protein